MKQKNNQKLISSLLLATSLFSLNTEAVQLDKSKWFEHELPSFNLKAMHSNHHHKSAESLVSLEENMENSVDQLAESSALDKLNQLTSDDFENMLAEKKPKVPAGPSETDKFLQDLDNKYTQKKSKNLKNSTKNLDKQLKEATQGGTVADAIVNTLDHKSDKRIDEKLKLEDSTAKFGAAMNPAKCTDDGKAVKASTKLAAPKPAASAEAKPVLAVGDKTPVAQVSTPETGAVNTSPKKVNSKIEKAEESRKTEKA